MGRIDFKDRKTGITILIIGLLVLMAGGVWWAISLRTAVKTDNAKVAGDLAELSPKVAGKITGIYVEEGQEVKAGQMLVKLDDSQYKINLEQAQAALHVAQATYKKLPDDIQAAGAAVEKSLAGLEANQASQKTAQVSADDARRQLGENESLFAAGAISPEAFKTSESNYSKAQANFEAAAANVASAQASLKSAQIAVESLNNSAAAVYLAQIEQAQALFNSAKLAEDNTIIYAEYDGTILRIPVSVGENVTAAQTLLTLSNLKNTWVMANIEEKKIGRIRIDQSVDVRIDAYPGKVFSGRVLEVGNASQSTFALLATESSSGSFTKVAQRIPIKIKVDGSPDVLKPGMSAVVKIYTR